MPDATLIIFDQCNVKFRGLDDKLREAMQEALKFEVPGARHMPAFKLGRWDGTISFCSKAGATFLNLLDRLLPLIAKAGYRLAIDDRRPRRQFAFPLISESVFGDRCWPAGHPMAGTPIILRDYQVDAVQTFIDNLQSVQQIATGSGKTILTAVLSLLAEPYGRSIVIVPSKNLVTQTEEDYRNVGLDVGVLYGERKEWGHRHSICTWQSLASLSKQDLIGEFVKDVICVINDEVHTAKAKLLRELLTGPLADVPIRWGLTGTVPKEEHEVISLLATIGPVVGQLRAADLQDRGVLAQCQVEIVQFQDDHVEFIDYESEHDFLLADRTRLTAIAGLIGQWSDSGNTLILVDRIETGEVLSGLLPESAFISGNMAVKARQAEYKSVQSSDQKIIVATYGVAAVGINIPRIFNLVLLEPGKSFIKVLQSIGRGLRRAQDKDHVNIYDLCSTLRFSRRHLSKRKAFYNEQDYPHHTVKVNY
jgi:superfamily II DNA or RNA helicase